MGLGLLLALGIGAGGAPALAAPGDAPVGKVPGHKVLGHPETTDPTAHWQAAAVLAVEQGDFGTGIQQTWSELSASLAYRSGGGAVRVTLPYLWLESDGAPLRGPGDLRLDGSLRLRRQIGSRPALYAIAALKLPTADAQAGLGTGESDLSLGVATDAFVSADVFWFADADYTLVGHSPSLPLRNQWRLGAGGGRYLTGTLVLSAALDARSPAYAGEAAPLALVLGLAGGERTGWQVSLTMGLSATAADVGLTAGWSFEL